MEPGQTVQEALAQVLPQVVAVVDHPEQVEQTVE
jgi:PII-like signaling protein